ncbi:hypothetical protein ACFL3C_05700, partial [Patescibacteria group bacterium]
MPKDSREIFQFDSIRSPQATWKLETMLDRDDVMAIIGEVVQRVDELGYDELGLVYTELDNNTIRLNAAHNSDRYVGGDHAACDILLNIEF